MTLIKDILRRKAAGASINGIARELKLSKSTVKKYIDRQIAAGLTDWNAADKLEDEMLESALTPSKRRQLEYAEPDWDHVLTCRRGKNPRTLTSLWEEYRDTALSVNPEAKLLSFSAFAKIFKRLKDNPPEYLKEYVATFDYRAGEITEIDYSGGGHGVVVTNPKTHERTEVHIFVAVLCHSNLTFFYATPGEKQDDWLDALIEMMNYFGGATSYIDLDNSTSLVYKASKHAPKPSAEFAAFCEHYGTTPFPVRPYEPRDKAHVEGAVRLWQNRCVPEMKDMKFFSIEDVNKTLRALCDKFNNAPLSKRIKESRRSLFEKEERACLIPLPPEPWEPSMIVKNLKVRKEGVVRFNDHRYSVPYRQIGCTVRVMVYPRQKRLVITDLHGQKLTEHELRDGDDGLSSKPEHIPPAVRYVNESVEEKIARIAKAGAYSKSMAETVTKGLPTRVKVKRLMGLQNYLNRLGAEKYEAQCKSAADQGVTDYDALELHLRQGEPSETETKRLSRGPLLTVPKSSKNVRGSAAYGQAIRAAQEAAGSSDLSVEKRDEK